MSFFGSIARGLGQAATGGDGKMNLSDYLKMAAMAGSIATGNVPAAVALGTSYAGDATGSEALKTIGDVGGAVAGGVGAVNALSAGAGAASSAGQAFNMVDDVAAQAANASPLMDAGMQASNMFMPTGAATGSALAGGADMQSFLSPGTDMTAQAGSGTMTGNAMIPDYVKQPGKFRQGIDKMFGDTTEEKFNTVMDVAGSINDSGALQQGPPPPAPNMQWTDTYNPSGQMDMQQYMQMSQLQSNNPYSGAYG